MKNNKIFVFLLTFFIIFAFELFIAKAEDEKNVTKSKEEEPKINQPQIIYIQYSTPEEAEEAKRRILAEYNALGGTAIISEEISPFISIDNTEKGNVNENVKEEITTEEPVKEDEKN